jgi:hypothetical protein
MSVSKVQAHPAVAQARQKCQEREAKVSALMTKLNDPDLLMTESQRESLRRELVAAKQHCVEANADLGSVTATAKRELLDATLPALRAAGKKVAGFLPPVLTAIEELEAIQQDLANEGIDVDNAGYGLHLHIGPRIERFLADCKKVGAR